jgi:hypothetical protein
MDRANPSSVCERVTASGNTGNRNPEQVSSITFAGGATSATGTPGQAGAVIATLAVNMSAAYWSFPTPPGTLALGGSLRRFRDLQPAGDLPAARRCAGRQIQ